jgi:nucleotide-binding universal stress UspA family protein
VLLLRGKEAPLTDALRVGIAVDGSKYGMAAVNHVLKAIDFFGKGAQFYLINVVNDYAGAVMPDMAGMALPALSESEVLELQKKEFAETVDPLRPLFEKAGLKPTEVCLVGNPSDEIAAFAKKNKLDLIVMGSHGYTRFKSAVMGSTATHIAAEGNVPLLIIRAADDESAPKA